MADTEFEEFRQTFEKLPSNLRAPDFYSIVPILDEDYPSSKSDSSSDQEDDKNNGQDDDDEHLSHQINNHNNNNNNKCTIKDDTERYRNGNNKNSDVLDLTTTTTTTTSTILQSTPITTNITSLQQIQNSQNNLLDKNLFFPCNTGSFERKRRKLPEIPKIKKASILHHQNGFTSLADEMGTPRHHHNNYNNSLSQRSLLTLKCSYLLDEDSSPDSERLQSFGDVDSGHSTAHSPNDFKSMSPQMVTSPTTISSPFPPPFGGVPLSQLEMLEATHRGLHKFIPRHHDEIEIEIGDPVYVQKEADDLWCEGVNLRTGRQGIFPSAYAVDLDYNDFDPSTVQVKKERYLLGYLGSVETISHKGTGVVCQAVRKITEEYGDSPKAQPCILEVSDQGLRMVDRSKPKNKEQNNKISGGGMACIDYFYSLKNVSFCAFHPRDHRYIGFITKHPTVQRFACHVFKGHESTRPVAEAVGRAFQRFYQKFIETAYPIEDIYIE